MRQYMICFLKLKVFDKLLEICEACWGPGVCCCCLIIVIESGIMEDKEMEGRRWKGRR